MNKYLTICFLLIILSVISCAKVKETNEMIEYTINKLTKNKNNYTSINEWVKKQEYRYPFFILRNRSKGIVYIEDNKDKIYSVDDFNFAAMVYNFITPDHNSIKVYKNVIIYYFSIRNKDMIDYKLLYFRMLPPKGYEEYKFYEKNETPTEVSGWIYHLKNNWYLMSPFPEKK